MKPSSPISTILRLAALSFSVLLMMSCANSPTEIAITELPDSYRTPCEQHGTVQTLTYTISSDTGMVTKSAQVYTPYGYDASNPKPRYNVLYLAHGGGDSSRSFFDGSHGSIPLSLIVDHLISEGRLTPLIVVGITYFPDDSGRVRYGMQETIELCRDFHTELEQSVIPAVGKAFPGTWYDASDPSTITHTRKHRAYGGFSMGALSTWYQLAYGLDAVGTFLPFSGDCWVYDEKGEKQSFETAAQWLNSQVAASPYAKEFVVHAFTGNKDIAGGPETALINALEAEAPLFHRGYNLTFSVLEEGDHSYRFINRYLCSVLPYLFPKK